MKRLEIIVVLVSCIITSLNFVTSCNRQNQKEEQKEPKKSISSNLTSEPMTQMEVVSIGDDIADVRKSMNWSEEYLSRFAGQWGDDSKKSKYGIENWPIGGVGRLTVVYDKVTNEIISMTLDQKKNGRGRSVKKFNVKSEMVLEFGELSLKRQPKKRDVPELPGLDLN